MNRPLPLFGKESYDILMEWLAAGKPKGGEVLGVEVFKEWRRQGFWDSWGSYAGLQNIIRDEMEKQYIIRVAFGGA